MLLIAPSGTRHDVLGQVMIVSRLVGMIYAGLAALHRDHGKRRGARSDCGCRDTSCSSNREPSATCSLLANRRRLGSTAILDESAGMTLAAKFSSRASY
jgi:hypothetical protein